jgi:hypothetical protein
MEEMSGIVYSKNLASKVVIIMDRSSVSSNSEDVLINPSLTFSIV